MSAYLVLQKLFNENRRFMGNSISPSQKYWSFRWIFISWFVIYDNRVDITKFRLGWNSINNSYPLYPIVAAKIGEAFDVLKNKYSCWSQLN